MMLDRQTANRRLGLLYLLLLISAAWWFLYGVPAITESTTAPALSVPSHWRLTAERRVRLAGRYALERIP